MPVSSTQAVVGSVIGIGLYRGLAKNIDWSVFLRIMCGWIITPIITALICFVSLYIMKNVFDQTVFVQKNYVLSDSVINEMKKDNILKHGLEPLTGKTYTTQKKMIADAVRLLPDLTNAQQTKIISYAEILKIKITPEKLKKIPEEMFSEKQISDLKSLTGKEFNHRWEIENTLAEMNPEWIKLPATVLNKKKNKKISEQLQIVEGAFKWE